MYSPESVGIFTKFHLDKNDKEKFVVFIEYSLQSFFLFWHSNNVFFFNFQLNSYVDTMVKTRSSWTNLQTIFFFTSFQVCFIHAR